MPNVVKTERFGIIDPHPHNIAKSAVRALDVMEYLAANGSARAVDISRALQLPASSADQLLKSMVDAAYLVLDERNKRYLPSARLARCARAIVETGGSNQAVWRAMKQIRDALNCMVVVLSSYSRGGLQIVEYISDGRSEQTIGKGHKVPVIESVAGRALLATKPASEVRRIVMRGRLLGTSDDQLLEALMAEIAAVREAGYAYGPSYDNRMWTVSVGLPSDLLGVDTVITVGGKAGLKGREAACADLINQHIKCATIEAAFHVAANGPASHFAGADRSWSTAFITDTQFHDELNGAQAARAAPDNTR